MGIFLLIVGGLVAWVVMAGIVKANARMAYADRQGALREIQEASEAHLQPSWANNADRMDEFVNSTCKLSDRNGIPRSYSRTLVREPHARATLLHFTALVEGRGSGFTNQQIAAGELVALMWSRLGADQKQMFRNVDQGHPPT